ncbi:interferon lambda-3-like [Glossophaga mutica]
MRHGGHVAGAEMRRSGAAVASVGLWVWVTVSVEADLEVAEPRCCLVSHYCWLDPRDLAAVRALRDHYEEETELEVTQLLLPPKEGSPMDLRRPAGWLAMLIHLPISKLFLGVARIPELLPAAWRDVVACPPPSAPDTVCALICLSFCDTDLPVGCMLVLMLMTTVLTRTGAVPAPTPLSALPGARGCPMAQFKFLSPQDMKAFRRAKDALEESLLQKNWSCSSHPFPRTRDLRQLQVWERPVALEAELALTLKVLETVANSTLADILDQPLHTLRYIHTKLQACVPAQATEGPRPRGHLHHWLRHLQESSKKESTGCLEASVTFNLFRLLTRDLKCVASGDLCV